MKWRPPLRGCHASTRPRHPELPDVSFPAWPPWTPRPSRAVREGGTADLEDDLPSRDCPGLYLDPPAHAVVLSVDEKPKIQALDRTQPGLPVKEGRPATVTHDYVRNGTTTLFAALNVLDGTVLGRCMQRHRHQEFLRFLNAVEAAVPAG